MTIEPNEQRTGTDRRTVLKTLGGTAVGLSGAAGVASAGGDQKSLEYNFYGCSQVCVNQQKVTAVVWTGKEFKFACIRRSSNRNDPPVRNWKNVYCYEVSGKRAIVGIWYGGDFISNPNRCAENYPKPNKYKTKPNKYKNACD